VIAELKSYRGVSCVRCGEPIPVSRKVVSLQEEIAQGLENLPHSFSARCQMCEQESIYEIKDLRKFDGPPPIRLTKARTAHLLFSRRAAP
jgi:hypothetical protein